MAVTVQGRRPQRSKGKIQVSASPAVVNVPFPSPLGPISAFVLTQDDHFLYAAGSSSPFPINFNIAVGKVWKIKKSTLKVVTSVTLPAISHTPQWICSDATHLYVLSWTPLSLANLQNGYVTRILKSNMTIVDNLDLTDAPEPGGHCYNPRLMAMDSNFLYVAGQINTTLTGWLTRINLPAFTIADVQQITAPPGYQCYSAPPCTLSVPFPDTIVREPQMVSDGTGVFSFTQSACMQEISQVTGLATRFTVTNTGAFAVNGAGNWWQCAVDATHLYFQGSPLLVTQSSHIIRYNRADLFTFTVFDTGILMRSQQGNESYFGVGLSQSNDATNIYFVSNTNPAKLYSLNKFDFFTVTLIATAPATYNRGRFALQDNLNPTIWWGITDFSFSRAVIRYI